MLESFNTYMIDIDVENQKVASHLTAALKADLNIGFIFHQAVTFCECRGEPGEFFENCSTTLLFLYQLR